MSVNRKMEHFDRLSDLPIDMCVSTSTHIKFRYCSLMPILVWFSMKHQLLILDEQQYGITFNYIYIYKLVYAINGGDVGS